MSLIKEIGEGLENIYLQREKIPTMWNKVTKFYGDNVWPDLIDIGEKVHMMRKSHSPRTALFATLFPRTIRNFEQFDKELNEYMDEDTEEINETDDKRGILNTAANVNEAGESLFEQKYRSFKEMNDSSNN